ncbi:MAG: glycoside hydrolase family 32 protein, partial [Clostridium sp.]|nr:glycoside hydrolase family 32 protein [Clostridium sp.]
MKKYNKVYKEDYEKWYRENQDYRDKVTASPYRLGYHLMPETGWLNDPNGLCQLNGIYHIYYQYTPFEPTGQIKLWGHYTTRDFVHYANEEPVLFPDKDFDAHGVYSGSAFAEDGTIHYFYTGNVKYFDRGDYDYIISGRGSNTVHFTSDDGYHFSEKELLMTTGDYPRDMSCHVRDPKIIKKGDTYYMALGARDKSGKGLVLLYQSGDLKKWSYYGRITTKAPFGYMWECPDLFWLDGKLCLICCPQGVEGKGIDFQNVHQCTAVVLDYDFEPGGCTIDDADAFFQMDRGFDFYAPQTFEDERGRRILIGWMGIPDAGYTNPTTGEGWQHCLTIPRVLHMENGSLIQQPAEELETLRGGKWEFKLEELLEKSGRLKPEALMGESRGLKPEAL